MLRGISSTVWLFSLHITHFAPICRITQPQEKHDSCWLNLSHFYLKFISLWRQVRTKNLKKSIEKSYSEFRCSLEQVIRVIKITDLIWRPVIFRYVFSSLTVNTSIFCLRNLKPLEGKSLMLLERNHLCVQELWCTQWDPCQRTWSINNKFGLLFVDNQSGAAIWSQLITFHWRVAELLLSGYLHAASEWKEDGGAK